MYVDRTYREKFSFKDMVGLRVVIKDTDLMILVDKDSYSDNLKDKIEKKTMFYRSQLEEYIEVDPFFKTTLEPYIINDSAPLIALEMVKAGNACGVGPMAAVAGCMAEFVGRFIKQFVKEVIVENGGDIFIDISKEKTVGIFTGNSPFADKLGLRIKPKNTPAGICTSSGIIGPSLSKGKADVVTVISPSTALADAVATATGNLVKEQADITKAIDFAKNINGITGVLIIKGEKMGAWGDIEMKPLQ